MILLFPVLLFAAESLAQSTVSAVESWLPAAYRMLGSDSSAEGHFLLNNGDDLVWMAHQYVDELGALRIEFIFKSNGIFQKPFSGYLLDKEAAIFAPQIDELCPENLLLETGK
jgi:hypothetical protein